MDLIRIYCEISFAEVAERWLNRYEDNVSHFSIAPSFILDKDCFLDEARRHHPDISDDSLRLIYQLGIDEWCRYGFEKDDMEDGNIMRVIANISKMLLRESDDFPVVQFRHMFRWREITQLIGEDLFTCALIAYNDRNSNLCIRSFDWPSVIHNDNPDLNFLFRTKGLCELHSHLKASTNIFEISWVSLMNEISHKDNAFSTLGSKHEPSRTKTLGEEIYNAVKIAALLRWDMYNLLISRTTQHPFTFRSQGVSTNKLDSLTALQRHSLSDKWIPDYIVTPPDSPMSVYTGERYFLYMTLKWIYSTNDQDLTKALYRYLLIKSLLRKYLVQINNNIGFSNFQRFQDIKTEFMGKGYSALPMTLPLWEAKKHNFTHIFESRIVPTKTKKEYLRKVIKLNTFNGKRNEFNEVDLEQILSCKDWMLIFHFLKRKGNDEKAHLRDYSVRKQNKELGISLADVGKFMKNKKIDKAIDAASSEFACRPEVFSQTFRFLRYHGFDITYHVGEDYYDIADGLRAIDEAITLLQLHSGDRLGHALALGINAESYYSSKHNMTALPIQWMLDNAVWLLMKSKMMGIQINSKTEWFLIDTYKHLVNEIGYTDSSETLNNYNFDISDYWESMALRGDNPDMYKANGKIKNSFSPSPEIWDHYALLDSKQANFIRDTNIKARSLFIAYHSCKAIKEKGEKVRVFELPSGYTKLVNDLQNTMIKEISKMQLCIECCPSSNVRIGRLIRFENHPIFRFSPINSNDTRYSLTVTVNTDDLGVFSTSLPNEYSLLALALLKKKDHEGNPLYSKQEVYDWISRIIDNGHKYTFINQKTPY